MKKRIVVESLPPAATLVAAVGNEVASKSKKVEFIRSQRVIQYVVDIYETRW